MTKHQQITTPIPPWELSEDDPTFWDHNPFKPERKDVKRLINRTFRGALNTSDLDYMAKAILQMHDEMHELRERVRILEAGGQ